jgi:fucokinase
VARRGTADGPLEEFVCTSLAEVEDYVDPGAPMALVKAALVCCGIVETNSSINLTAPASLTEQLQLRIGSGLGIETWSMLPVGSGMGGSSILGAALLYCLAVCSGMGVHKTSKSLIHDVIRLEKLSNGDCGWQDQAGGVVPGAKFITSSISLPLCAHTERLQLVSSNSFRFR